jgi:hypothetical protein
MADAFGQLLYLEDRRATDDPYKGELILNKLGSEDTTGVYTFSVPENLRSLKLEKCKFVYDVDIDSNYVPDNGFHAKTIKRWHLYLYESRIFDSFDINEYTWFDHFKKKLNKSGATQCLDMFPQGHYDDRELHADELVGERFSRQDISLIENRHQYAKKYWKRDPTKISFSSDPSAGSFSYERLTYKHSIRAPIAHGLASQPRVIPSGVKISMELELNTMANSLLKVDDYQLCRTKWSEATHEAFKRPFHPSLKKNTITENHTTFEECDCVDKHGDYETIQEIKNVSDMTPDDIAVAAKSIDDLTADEAKDATLYATKPASANDSSPVAGDSWKAHQVSWRQAVTEKTTDPDTQIEYIEFYWKNNLNPTDLPKLSNLMLEHVFVHSSKAERPLTNGKKGVAVIPFLYSRSLSHAFPVNTRSHTFHISQGALPHMILLTGIPHERYAAPSFEHCLTKTSMIDPDFEIEEFTIFVNHRESLRTPWRKPLDHYMNLMIQNGRSSNRIDVGGGMDFEKFKSENWMVPIIFDDEAGMNGVVDVRITFKKPTTRRWDLLKTIVPVEELHIDTERKSKLLILFAGA